jgi:hypothetical protein
MALVTIILAICQITGITCPRVCPVASSSDSESSGLAFCSFTGFLPLNRVFNNLATFTMMKKTGRLGYHRNRGIAVALESSTPIIAYEVLGKPFAGYILRNQRLEDLNEVATMKHKDIVVLVATNKHKDPLELQESATILQFVEYSQTNYDVLAKIASRATSILIGKVSCEESDSDTSNENSSS